MTTALNEVLIANTHLYGAW